MMRLATALACGALCGQLLGQVPDSSPPPADYSTGRKLFPHFWKPYQSWQVPGANLANTGLLQTAMHDGRLALSLELVIQAVVENNLSVAAARLYPAMAQTDLLRARSGGSPRGVDAAVVPNDVFAGAEGGSILGTAGGGGGGASNAGGITGAATAVNIRPSGIFDPSLSVAFSIDHTVSPLNSTRVSGVPVVTTGTGAFSVNYVQAFSTGTSFTVSYSMQRQGSTQEHILFDPAFTPGFTATVSQQMLNGFGTRVNKALIKVAENEQKIERESFRQQLIAAIVSAKNAYWDLVAAKESVQAAQEALVAAQQLAANNRRQFETGTMAQLDVVTADSQVAASQRDLIVAQTNVQNAELTLKSMLVKRLDEPFASAPVDIVDSFPEPDNAQLPKPDEAVKTANDNRPEVSIAQGNIKSQQDVLPFLHNALLPSVNVFGLLSTVGLYNVFGTSFTEAIHFRYPQYAFGLTISFPVHNRQAQADDIRSRMELDQAKDTLVRTQSQIEVDVQNALIAVAQSRAQAAAARETVQLEQQKLDAEKQKLNTGLSTSYNVVLIQRDLLAAQLAEVQALDAYAKARVSLDQAMGTTLESNHVDLDAALRGRAR
ncbi:MAG TPA: TolC family protein [Bryobacteraceae bacterium]|nr:TolC family protein [Bryobacteraceae bacterium]